MRSTLETIQKFIPLIVQFPTWVQVFIFAVILQILALAFVMFIYSVYPPKKVNISQASGIESSNSKNVENTPLSEELNVVRPGVDIDSLAKSKDPNVALSLANLATSYEAQGKYKQAEDIWGKVVSINEAAYGVTHPAYAESIQSLARLHSETGKLQEALLLQRKVVHVFELTYGEDHPKTATSLNRLAAVLLKLAKYSEAAPLIERALRIREQSLGDDHPELIAIYENLLSLYSQAGDSKKIEEVKTRLKTLKEKFPNG